MTCEKVMLTVAAMLLLTGLNGCAWFEQGVKPPASPYPSVTIYAVAPMLNESGSLSADGLILADHLANALESVDGLQVYPVNRALAAMQTLGMAQVATKDDALKLLNLLEADALVVGVITAYDPYDPPKLGMALEIYWNPRQLETESVDLRALTSAATSETVRRPTLPRQPVTSISGYLDAATPQVRELLQQYAQRRGGDADDQGWRKYRLQRSAAAERSWVMHRISMDLYSQFVCYDMSWRLMQAEQQRLSLEPNTFAP